MAAPARYLAICPQGLGDALEATPALAALKRAEPDSTIDALVLREGPRELFEGLPDLIAWVHYLPYWELGKVAFLKALAARVGFARYAASFLMYPAARPEYHLLAPLLGAKRRFAHRYFAPSARNLLWLDTDLVPVRATRNVHRNEDLISTAGFDPGSARGYEVPAGWRDPAPRNARVLAVHVGTVAHDGLEARRWPADYFVDLIRRMRARGWRVHVLAGPSEREVSREVANAALSDGLIEWPLRETARFISTCSALVANDGGIAHLAAGVGTPVLAIFGPTPLEFAPFGERALGFRPSECPPCFDPRLLNTACARNIDYACLKRDASVDRVEAALLRLLASAPAKAR